MIRNPKNTAIEIKSQKSGMKHFLILLVFVSVAVAAVGDAFKPVSELEPKHSSIKRTQAQRQQQQQRAVALDPQVTINVGYPSSLLQGANLFLRGSFPLSWTQGVQLTAAAQAPSTWTITLPTQGQGIWGNATNATFFELDFKIVMADAESGWELGRNHRFVIQRYGPAVQTMKVCPYFSATASQQVTFKNVFSPELNNSRDVWAYIPAQMLENTACTTASLLVMGDGQNLAPLWNLPKHLDEAILGTMQIAPMVVIGPYNTGFNRIYEYTFCGCAPYTTYALGDQYLDFLEQTLLPYIAKQFATQPLPPVDFSPRNRGLGGSSLGGLIAAYAGVTRPQSWTTIVAMSSSYWWCDKTEDKPEAFLHSVLPKMTSLSPRTQNWYLDTGDSGDGADDQHETSRVITRMTLMFGGRVENGQFEIGQNLWYNLERQAFHNEQYWSNRMPRALGWTYGRDGLNNDW